MLHGTLVPVSPCTVRAALETAPEGTWPIKPSACLGHCVRRAPGVQTVVHVSVSVTAASCAPYCNCFSSVSVKPTQMVLLDLSACKMFNMPVRRRSDSVSNRSNNRSNSIAQWWTAFTAMHFGLSDAESESSLFDGHNHASRLDHLSTVLMGHG